jgi:hypothetical protein
MAISNLSIYDLLAPQFLADFTFPDYIDRYLSKLRVDSIRMAIDDISIAYIGDISFDFGADRQHRDPSGAIFDINDVSLKFRLTVPRDGTKIISDAASVSSDLSDLFKQLGEIDQTSAVSTEYPGVRFKLELMLNALTFHMGSEWVPGMSLGDKIVRNDEPEFRDQKVVKIVLPKIVLQYEQSDDWQTLPIFRVNSWGSAGFDAPHDLKQGELVRMEPPIALHENGRLAFGVGQILMDLSEENTPPEILAFFGTDESFKGLFFKSLNFFYLDENRTGGINIAVNDALISFKGEISLEASVDVLMSASLGKNLKVKVKFYDGGREIDYTQSQEKTSLNFSGGNVTVSQTAVAHVEISGGVPDYNVQVLLNGIDIWNSTERKAFISPGMLSGSVLHPVGRYTMEVKVEDTVGSVSGLPPTPSNYENIITVSVIPAELHSDQQDGSPADHPTDLGTFQPAVVNISPTPPGYSIQQAIPIANSTTETLIVIGGKKAIVKVFELGNSAPILSREVSGSDRRVSFDVPHGKSFNVAVTYQAIEVGTSEIIKVLFDENKPSESGWGAGNISSSRSSYANFTASDTKFNSTRSALISRLQGGFPEGTTVDLLATASFEQNDRVLADKSLSERRLDVANDLLANISPNTIFGNRTAIGFTNAQSSGSIAKPEDRAVAFTFNLPLKEEQLVSMTISRPLRTLSPVPTATPVIWSSPPATAPLTRRPAVIKRLTFRVRLERNVPVLLELSGQIDFETELEQHLRQNQNPSAGSGSLELTNRNDGLVDFKINVTYDTATKQLNETLSLNAAPEDIDGLLHMNNDRASGAPRTNNGLLKDIFGALLTFAPVINAATTAVIERDTVADWTTLAVSLGVPIAIAALDVFQTKKITLYGGEMRLRQYLPTGTDPFRFTDAGIVFDYGVEFGIFIESLGIKTTQPLKVRYKAIGFNLHFENGVSYQPIFDASKGYEINLSDPGLFNLPSPLGDLLKISSARIARFNPLTLELDFQLKVDLGIVTVDRFKVKLPLDPPGVPMIMPSGAKVNIPGVLIGSGFVNIIERNTATGSEKGIEGGLDVTLVAFKLRIAASLGVVSIKDKRTERKAVAVFVGLAVEFPAPIPLWASGIGLYGLSGLFAMHYKRLEESPVPGASAGPALKWLIKAKGDPAQLKVDGEDLWVPELDRWSFGVGVVLGTVDGGFVMNFQGMFVLELPGPRILIFVKIKILAKLPKLKPANKLDVGILGVIDLDLGRGQLTIGVIVDFSIKNLIEVALAIEIFFKFNDIKQFHLYVGTQLQPASALFLNLVRARGYFMIDGNRIAPFPPPSGAGLSGLAIATGIEASIIFGNINRKLYLRVAAGAHLGVAFSPLFLVGRLYLTGELRLFIVSIEARGEFDIEAPNPTYIHGKICGRVNFFFFSVKGCVQFSIGSKDRLLPPPELIRGVYLQSFAPVITAGQGGDKPIDASLGDAIMLQPDGSLPSGIAPDKILTVPIDSVPVIQFHASPILGSGFKTFTLPLNTAPGLMPDGWIDVGGGRRVRYILQEILLEETSSDGVKTIPVFAPDVPATWRKDNSPGDNGVKTNIDLALFSRVPFVAPRALERSTELNELVKQRWSNLCQPIAPPTSVLWTWCNQPLGTSGSGWNLEGVAMPDPPGTRRSKSPNIHLYVEEPEITDGDAILDQLMGDLGESSITPARVIGINPNRDRNLLIPAVKTCVAYNKDEKSKNPRNELFGQLRGFDSNSDRKIDQISSLTVNKLTGLLIEPEVELIFKPVVCAVEITLVQFSPQRKRKLESNQPATVIAFDQEGNIVYKAALTESQNVPQTLRFQEKNIQRVQISTHGRVTLLLSVCTEPCSQQEEIQNVNCYRALQLPATIMTSLPIPRENDELIQRALDHIERTRLNTFVTLHTGEAQKVRLFFSILSEAINAIFIRELDADDNLIKEYSLINIPPTWITGITTNLPPEWLSPSWKSDITSVSNFFADKRFSEMLQGWVDINPNEKCTKIQISITDKKVYGTTSVFLLGAIQVYSLLEETRATTDESIKTGEIKTVQNYLNGGDVVPLLKPNCTYTITIKYDVKSNGYIQEQNVVQKALFRTDAKEPSRLESYVLGTTPTHEDKFHFCDDPINVVFNDSSVIQLYNAYGKKLKIIVRSADGAPYPPDEIKTLEPIVGSISGPFRDTLEQLAGSLPCAGSVSTPSHGSYTSPVKLRPLMAYTLDIELDPPSPEILLPNGNIAPKIPLYRRQFETSRYGGVEELITALKMKRIKHRALKAPVSLTSKPFKTISMATDIEIQTALRASGEQALPAPEETGITIYWVQRSIRGEKGSFSPHIIMIDAAEPLWRSRSEPILEVVRNIDGQEIDPAFKRAISGTQVSLELQEGNVNKSGRLITQFVRSTSGTRTLAFMLPIHAIRVRSMVEIELHRPVSSLYQISDLTQNLIELELYSSAPWENDQP